MTPLKVSQIKSSLLKAFQDKLDLSGIGEKDPDREQKILSRCLAAIAIQIKCGCTAEEAAASVWDGPDDNGIDSAYFDSESSRVILTQAKWISDGNSEPSAKELGVFAKGVTDLVEGDSQRFHARLGPRVEAIIEQLGIPGTSVLLVPITTGKESYATHGQQVLDDILTRLNGENGDELVTCEILGISSIYSALANEDASSSVNLDATILNWSTVTTPYRAYFGVIDGSQLKHWWSTHGKRLFSANIRHSLGHTDVNSAIKATAISKPENFWYFNNGITLVAKKVERAPAGTANREAGNFQFKEASVVNGAQTVSTLGRIDNDASLGHVRVPIRAIILEGAPAEFGHEVTKTNNFQNRVEPRDFVSSDPQQRRLQQEMAIEGYSYQFLRGDNAEPNPGSCELIEVTTALACASRDPNLVVQVKTGISRIFADLEKGSYKSLFNPSVTGARAFNVTSVLRAIDEWIVQKKAATKKKGAVWGILVHGNRILAAAVFSKISDARFNTPIADFSSKLGEIKIATLCESAYSNMVAEVQANFRDKFLAVLFKNPTLSRQVYEAATK